jgi:hypothetical protein
MGAYVQFTLICANLQGRVFPMLTYTARSGFTSAWYVLQLGSRRVPRVHASVYATRQSWTIAAMSVRLVATALAGARTIAARTARWTALGPCCTLPSTQRARTRAPLRRQLPGYRRGNTGTSCWRCLLKFLLAHGQRTP